MNLMIQHRLRVLLNKDRSSLYRLLLLWCLFVLFGGSREENYV